MQHSKKTALIFVYVLAGIIALVPPCLCFAEPSLQEATAKFRRMDLERRVEAIQKLEGRRDEYTIDFLMAVVDNGWENWQVKIWAIQLLGEAENSKAVDLLLRIFESRSLHYSCPAIKTYTARALSNFGEDDRIQDTFIGCIHHDEPQVREACVQSLAMGGDARALPHLILLLNDHSVAMRLNAVRALERLSDPRAVPYLKILSENDRDEIVRNVAEAAVTNFHNR
jgi:HEAT repeat protein